MSAMEIDLIVNRAEKPLTEKSDLGCWHRVVAIQPQWDTFSDREELVIIGVYNDDGSAYSGYYGVSQRLHRGYFKFATAAVPAKRVYSYELIPE